LNHALIGTKKLGIMIHQYKSKFGGKRMLEQNIEFSLLGMARWFKSFYFICITLYILKLFSVPPLD